MPLAQHQALLHHHIAQRVQGPLGLAFLDKTQCGIEQHHAGDYDGIREHMAAQSGEYAGDYRGDHQHDHHGVIELAQEANPCGGFPECYLVGTELLQARCRNRLVQAGCAALKIGEQFFPGLVVPRRFPVHEAQA